MKWKLQNNRKENGNENRREKKMFKEKQKEKEILEIWNFMASSIKQIKDEVHSMQVLSF